MRHVTPKSVSLKIGSPRLILATKSGPNKLQVSDFLDTMKVVYLSSKQVKECQGDSFSNMGRHYKLAVVSA